MSLSHLFFHEHNLLHMGDGKSSVLRSPPNSVFTLWVGENLPHCAQSWKEKGYMRAFVKYWANKSCWESEIISIGWGIHWHWSPKALDFLLSEQGLVCSHSKLPFMCNIWCKHTASKCLFTDWECQILLLVIRKSEFILMMAQPDGNWPWNLRVSF